MKRAADVTRAVLVATVLACSPLAPAGSAGALASPEGTPTLSASAVASPRATAPSPDGTRCVPVPTPFNPEPSHAPVNGVPDLGVPVLRGAILVQVAQCREITAVLVKYGLAGPATRYIPGVTTPESATRWFRVSVAEGTESQTVVRLHEHPEDIEYVQLIPVPPQPISTQPP